MVKRGQLGDQFAGAGRAAADGVDLLDGLHGGLELVLDGPRAARGPRLANARGVRQQVHVLRLVLRIQLAAGFEERVH